MGVGRTRSKACPRAKLPTLHGTSELPQEAEISALQPADIVDCVTHHYQARQAEAEREAVPFFGIDAAHAEHMRIHQAAWKKLHPAALPAHRASRAAADQTADIELESGLDEREKSGPEPHRHLAPEDR